MTKTSDELGKAYRNAIYAPLTSRAVTDNAHNAIEALVKQIATHERERKKRKHGRVTKAALHRKAVEGFVGDLLRAQLNETAHGLVYHPMAPRSFTGGPVSHRMFKGVVEALEGLGLLERAGGFQQKIDFGSGRPGRGKGWATRFRATRKLLKFAEKHGVPIVTASLHFIAALPKEPLQVRERSPRTDYGDKVRGRIIKWRSEYDGKRRGKGEKLESSVEELNQFFDRVDLRGGMHRGYVMSFNNGNDTDFAWNKGGRLYSQGEGTYQHTDRADRLKMTFNGERVCEIDIRASYLTIFHAWHDSELDNSRDPYELAELGKGSRDAVKIWFVATFGSNKHIAKWPKEIAANYLKETGTRLSKYSTKLVKDKVLDAFPLMRLWGTDKSKGDWSNLMWVESDIMFTTEVVPVV